MEHLQVFQEAQQAIRHVVKAFSFFRTDNLLLSNLLQNIESLLEAQPQKYNNNDDLNQNIETSNDFPVYAGSKKRKLHCGFDENGAINDDDDDDGNLNSSAVKNSEPSGPSHSPPSEEKSPEDQVFAIDLLLEYIFSELSTSDLKHCRYVNSTWNSSATKILNKKGALNIKFTYNTESKAFESTDRSKSATNINLTEFSDFIIKTYSYQNQNSSRIVNPFVNFALTSGNLNEPSLQNFLRNCGYFIKQLELELYGNSDNHNIDPDHDPSNQFEILRDFKKLLTDYLPNVEVLKLGKFPPLWLEDADLSQLFPEPKNNKIKCLPQLKSLYFTSAPPLKIFEDLLDSSSDACASASDALLNYKENKLQSIGLVGSGTSKCDEILTTLIEKKKLQLLKCFELQIQPENLSFFEKFCVSHPRLRFSKLIVHIENMSTDLEYWIRVSQVLTKILKACSETLSELHVQPLGDCLGLEIPVLRELKKIRTLKWNTKHRHDKLFPDGLKFSQVFPNLETFESTVDYYAFHYPDMQWEYIFGASKYDELKSVKHVHFTCGPPSEWIENFCRMWPNLESVNVGITEDFPRASRALWKLQNLESLGIIISIEDDDETNSHAAMDQGFTGLSNDTCVNLFHGSREIDSGSVQGWREHCSILDAKSLRRLDVSVHESSLEDREGETFSVMSHITGLFAFKMCPQLRITLGYSAGGTDKNLKMLKNGLSSILPYVHEVREGRDPYDYYMPS